MKYILSLLVLVLVVSWLSLSSERDLLLMQKHDSCLNEYLAIEHGQFIDYLQGCMDE